jgi:transcription-repair coupling factor (superfamily II helicase)
MSALDCEQIVEHLHGDVAAPDAAKRLWRVQGLKGGARPYFVWRFLARFPRPALIILPSAKQAEAFADDLRFFSGEDETAPPFARRIHYFPGWDVVPFEDLSPTSEMVAARIEGLYHLQQTKDPIVVTTADAVLQRVPPRERFGRRLCYLVEADELDLGRIAAQLEQWGYRRVPLVEDRGDFSVRGGILDVHPPAHSYPLRIELIGDRIESIREFDPVTQRSLDRRPELLILPVREFDTQEISRRETVRAIEARALDLDVGREERNQLIAALSDGLLFPGIEFLLPYFHPSLDTLAAYLPAETLLWADDAGAVDAALERAWVQVERLAAERAAAHRLLPPVEQLYLTPAQWRAAVAGRPTVELESLDVMAVDDQRHYISMRSFLTRDLKLDRAGHRKEVSFGPVAEQVRAWSDQGYRAIVVASTPAQVERLTRLFGNHDVLVELAATIGDALAAPAGRPRLVVGHLHDGFRLPDEHLAIATESDIFGEARQRRRARRVEITQLLKNLSELRPDDFVVHLDHGVGVYRGLKHLQVAGMAGDYLHLEYAGGDRLYLPVDRISLVQKYVGADGAAPALDKLGGTSWERVKKKTKESILAMAKDLLAIYARREVIERKAFSAPDAYFREFEAAFPFEETPDQQQAIDDVLADLQRLKPMDRLICGDVGYGKTEVALRAAFLTVLDGGQVVVLVPTTVLAQQHYTTFRQRFAGYPVRVEMLSRFRTPVESRTVVKEIASGAVDVVIGTHRLLQKDLQFKNLRLLVVDEEHRFGVVQ